MSATKVYETQPKDFKADFEAVGCFVESQGEILLLKRALQRSNPGQWSIPTGHIEAGESQQCAAARELFEETAVQISPSHLEKVATYFVKGEEGHYTYHIYRTELEHQPLITLNSEHTECKWVSPRKALDHKLVKGGADIVITAYSNEISLW